MNKGRKISRTALGVHSRLTPRREREFCRHTRICESTAKIYGDRITLGWLSARRRRTTTWSAECSKHKRWNPKNLTYKLRGQKFVATVNLHLRSFVLFVMKPLDYMKNGFEFYSTILQTCNHLAFNKSSNTASHETFRNVIKVAYRPLNNS